MNAPEKLTAKLIDVYLNWVYSGSEDAGWHQPSMLQKMIEFAGDMPQGTGNDQADLKMMREIRFLREEHALLPLAKEIIGGVNPKYRIPLLVVERYRGQQCATTGKRWTDLTISKALGITQRQLRHRVMVATTHMNRKLREMSEKKPDKRQA